MYCLTVIIRLKSYLPMRFDARFLAAFLAIYVIWGSTYLAIRVAVETIPPLAAAGLPASLRRGRIPLPLGPRVPGENHGDRMARKPGDRDRCSS